MYIYIYIYIYKQKTKLKSHKIDFSIEVLNLISLLVINFFFSAILFTIKSPVVSGIF